MQKKHEEQAKELSSLKSNEKVSVAEIKQKHGKYVPEDMEEFPVSDLFSIHEEKGNLKDDSMYESKSPSSSTTYVPNYKEEQKGPLYAKNKYTQEDEMKYLSKSDYEKLVKVKSSPRISSEQKRDLANLHNKKRQNKLKDKIFEH